ncbi:desulfoferrodoxin [uncultured Mailhella sp.]|uniref:desulfoferrodoxin n=1 Tax=uncultured Mailhella sp. TaxID=1981031 RepID=UPI0026338073|nr:desulfoferrodoxin [uncultured Mailhella sp.]
MPARLDVYQCKHCGNIAEILHGGVCTMTCCGEPMQLLREGTTDGALEKHVPVIEKTADGYKVKVGAVAHPMADDHYIEWIELIADGISYTRFLKPGDAPEAEFCVKADKVTAREFCNKHGQWKAEL